MAAVHSLPTLALTAGEPAGIGPDLCVQLAKQALCCKLVVIADREMIRERASLLQIPLNLHDVTLSSILPHQVGCLQVMHVPLSAPAFPGKLNKNNAGYVLKTLDQAVQGCLEKKFDAVITAPVHKAVINEAGFPFAGHTEFISQLTGGLPVMMLAGENMRVALATTHLPLKDVAKSITSENIENKLRVIRHHLIHDFSITSPCIAVSGLNPHAGESGHLGTEEINTIIPVLHKLRLEGFNLFGPIPADTLFLPGEIKKYDCIFVMYHDQGLPVLKHASFGGGVNVTLGLPIIRTSVDHGTALDLAATGRAKVNSLIAAINMAVNVHHARAIQ